MVTLPKAAAVAVFCVGWILECICLAPL